MSHSNAQAVAELCGLLDKDKLSEALSSERVNVRIDAVTMLLRDALTESSMGMYGGVLYYFGGKVYLPLSSDEFSNVIYDVMREVGLPVGDYGRVEMMVKVCRRAVSVKRLELSSDKMVFRNCVYDVQHNECCGFSRDCVQFYCADYDYDKTVKGFLWKHFLNQVLPNKVHQRILQEFVGSLFVDRRKVKIETLLVLKGSGSNGKSVVFDTLRGLLGHENVSTFSLDELIGGGLEKKRNLATMNGKRLNYASESGQFVIDGNSGILKAIISGEPVEARAMYGENFTACDLPLIIINTNHMPTLKDFSHGMRRRLCILPFEIEVPKERQDKELAARLRSEYSYIFRWAMAGRRRFIEQGYKLTDSATVEQMLDEYEEMNSSALTFMRRKGYEREPEMDGQRAFWIPYKELYNRYLAWCEEYDEKPDNKRKFSLTLLDAGYKRASMKNELCYAIYGMSVVAEMYAAQRDEAQKKVFALEERRRITLAKYKSIEKRVKEDFGWERVAVGDGQLEEYVGYRVSIASQLRSGFLDGCYKDYGNIRAYNLDLIDTIWRPAFESRVRERHRRLEVAKANKQLMEEFNLVGVDDTIDDEIADLGI